MSLRALLVAFVIGAALTQTGCCRHRHFCRESCCTPCCSPCAAPCGCSCGYHPEVPSAIPIQPTFGEPSH